jgi:hypothetical protein
MIQPTALNIIIVGLAMVVFVFLWRMAAMALVNRNPESGLGKAMGTLL